MGKELWHLFQGGAEYHEENIGEKLKINHEKELLQDKKAQEMLKKIDAFCGISSGVFDRKKCMEFLDGLFKYSPQLKKKYEEGKEAFKKALVEDLREKQYVGGLLSALSYYDAHNFNIQKLEHTYEQLKKANVPFFTPDVLEDIQTTLFILKTLASKGFNIDTIKQVNDPGGLSAMYLENSIGKGYIIIRGTNNVLDWIENFVLGITNGGYHPQIPIALEAFKTLVPKGKRVTLHGHSLGGYLAQVVALSYPEHITEVITYEAPGIQDYPIPSQLLQMRPHKYPITNIVVGSKNYADGIGKRIGTDVKMKNINGHKISGINNNFLDMSPTDITQWTHVNHTAIAMSEKESVCDNDLQIDRPACLRTINRLKNTYKDNAFLQTQLEKSEKLLDAQETKIELMLDASAENIEKYSFERIEKKYPHFSQLRYDDKYRFITQKLFENENREDLTTMLSIMYLEKNGYLMKDIKIFFDTQTGINIIKIPHKDGKKQFISFQGGTKNFIDENESYQNIDEMVKNMKKYIDTKRKNTLIGKWNYALNNKQGNAIVEQIAIHNTSNDIDKIFSFEYHTGRFGVSEKGLQASSQNSLTTPVIHINHKFAYSHLPPDAYVSPDAYGHRIIESQQENFYQIDTYNDFLINFPTVIHQMPLEEFAKIFHHEIEKNNRLKKAGSQ